MRHFVWAAAITVLPLLAPGTPAVAAGANPAPVQLAQQGGGASMGQIYGSQLMTQQERLQYREQMRNARTAQEREQIRARHHAEMQARARKRGITLPDEAPADRGSGMGGGMGVPGMGGGMGRGMGGGRR